MAFSESEKFRKVAFTDSDDDNDNETIIIKSGSDCSPSRPVVAASVLKSSNNANITPTKTFNSNSSSSIADSDGVNGKGANYNNYMITNKEMAVLENTNTSDKDDRKVKTGTGNKSGRTTPFTTPLKNRPQQQLILSAFRDIHDLTKLECITMENVLECLRERYRCHHYYTYAGPVLLSLNSCLKLPRASLVEDVTKMSWYFIDDAKRQNKENENGLKSSKSPHVYDIGYQSLRNLVTVGSDQIILISGESGAGKTTATQQLIKYLTENNSRNFGANICSNLDKKIYFATLILESFGNAKTQANPNSSRFGRLVQLNYGKGSGQIMGAEIQTYLLEKHRVAKYDFRSERNFHIVYYILHGLKFGTILVPDISWENAKQLFQQDLLIDALECENDEILRLINAIQAFNMTDFPEMVKILLAMIALLNVVFVPECDTSSEEDHFSSGLESPYKTEFTVSDKKCVHFAASLLGIIDTELMDVLIARKITAGNSSRYSIFRKPCENIRECEERLHALTSFIYDRLFSFVLDHLNFSLKGNSSQGPPEDFSTLSLLDLYGFENFHVNHLEQICINYANERLQQINVSIVKSYYEQSIPPDEVMIPPTELIRIEAELKQRVEELHTHVFTFFDEECLLKRSTEDKDILERLSKNLTDKKSNFIKTSKKHEPGYKFTVTHYATKVEYQLTGLVQKNKDHIPPEFQDILRSSTNCFVHSLFKHDLIRSRNLSGASGNVTPRSFRTVNSNKNARGKTILTRFKQSVEELMIRLKVTENKDIHFVRCIRPNPDLLAGTFSMDVVEKQLHACGIADVVKIAGNGYPIRLYTKKFITEFPKVLHNFCNGTLDTKALIAIFSTNKTKSLKFGKTMVFMSEKCWTTLKKTEKFLTLHNARIIQKAWKVHLDQKEHLRQSISHMTCNSTIIQRQLNNSESFHQVVDENESRTVDDTSQSSISSPPCENLELGISQTVENIPVKRIPRHNGPPPSLYFGVGIASRVPVHTLPIKIYAKKTCLPFAEKRPKRLLANGIQDAIEDYGIVLSKT